MAWHIGLAKEISGTQERENCAVVGGPAKLPSYYTTTYSVPNRVVYCAVTKGPVLAAYGNQERDPKEQGPLCLLSVLEEGNAWDPPLLSRVENEDGRRRKISFQLFSGENFFAEI